MSSILSAQNLQTLRRRKSVRRCPCWSFLSPALPPSRPPLLPPRPPLLPRPPPPPPRPGPNGTSNLHFKTIVVLVVALGRSTLARLSHRRQTPLDAAPLGFHLALGTRALD